jgi:hypothetical protein
MSDDLAFSSCLRSSSLDSSLDSSSVSDDFSHFDGSGN